MEYLRIFEDHSDYVSYASGEDFLMPNVSYCAEQNEVHYNPENMLVFNENYARLMSLLECAVKNDVIDGVTSVTQILDAQINTGYQNMTYTLRHLMDWLFNNDLIEYVYTPASQGETYYPTVYTYNILASSNDIKTFLCEENNMLPIWDNNKNVGVTSPLFRFTMPTGMAILEPGSCESPESVFIGGNIIIVDTGVVS